MLVSSEVQRFTVGICASDEAQNLPELLNLVETEIFPEEFFLTRIIVVASGCSRKTLDIIRRIARKDPRLILLEEDLRHGKAEAVNRIIENSLGDYLLFVNSDTLPLRGSSSELLLAAKCDAKAGVVSGKPYFESRRTLTSKVEQLMWLAHNECSARLDFLEGGNHTSDELMVVKSEILEFLPYGLVNDGAYFASRATSSGYSVAFCRSAGVRINVPNRWVDLISQRRRILFGHFQVRKFTGQTPRTVESMLVSSPLFSLDIIVSILSRNPKLIFALPFAVVGEALSFFLAVKDWIVSTEEHRVWRRYGN